MQIARQTLVASVLLASAATSAVAAGDAAPTIPSDRNNYLGDKIKFPFAMAVRRVDLTKPTGNVDAACAPAFTTLQGIGKLSINADNKTAQVAAFVVTFVPDDAATEKAGPAPATSPAAAAPQPQRTARCATGASRVRTEDIVVVDDAMLTGTPPDRYGLTYGALLVPYKYQLKGDRSFGSKAAVGGYLGFRQDKSGITGLALQYVGFLGVASVPVTQTVDGKPVTQELTGVSYGLGLLGTVKGEFQMGLVIGADRVSKSSGYINNGKPWVAISLGFGFSN